MPPRATPARWLPAVALLGTLALAGCSAGSTGPQVAALGSTGPTAAASPSSSVNREKAALDFAQCMRSNGVSDFPDPTVDGDGNVRLGLGGAGAGINPSDPRVQKALSACRSKLQSLRPNFTPEQRQQLQDALLKYAQCMRSNGYQMADPNFDGNGGALRSLGQINRSDPAFQKADGICRPKTLGTLPFGSGRGGGGSPSAATSTSSAS